MSYADVFEVLKQVIDAFVPAGEKLGLRTQVGLAKRNHQNWEQELQDTLSHLKGRLNALCDDRDSLEERATQLEKGLGALSVRLGEFVQRMDGKLDGHENRISNHGSDLVNMSDKLGDLEDTKAERHDLNLATGRIAKLEATITTGHIVHKTASDTDFFEKLALLTESVESLERTVQALQVRMGDQEAQSLTRRDKTFEVEARAAHLENVFKAHLGDHQRWVELSKQAVVVEEAPAAEKRLGDLEEAAKRLLEEDAGMCRRVDALKNLYDTLLARIQLFERDVMATANALQPLGNRVCQLEAVAADFQNQVGPLERLVQMHEARLDKVEGYINDLEDDESVDLQALEQNVEDHERRIDAHKDLINQLLDATHTLTTQLRVHVEGHAPKQVVRETGSTEIRIIVGEK